jgi:phosphate transport system substrate-binding protein
MEKLLGRTAACSLLLTFLAGPAAAQQQPTLFCLSDGKQVSAERFETHDGKFFLYTAGSSTPQEYPVSSVKGINVRCADGAPLEPADQAAQQPHSFAIHGSNTIGERLMPMLIEAYSEQKLHAKAVSKFIGIEEEAITLKLPDGGKEVINLQSHGSATSAPDLLDKSIIGMSSRRINAEESAALTAKFGINPQQSSNEHVLALDGVAVIVNQANPITQLSLDQIARIFAGELTDWGNVGGAKRPIKVYRRDDKSGTTDTFKALVMARSQLKFGTDLKAFESSELVSSSVASDPDGIGYIGLPYVNQNRALAISTACGIVASPSPFTIKTESYPLMRRLYLYTTGVSKDPVARDLVDFALSDQAQSTVQDAGFVDQKPELEDPADQREMVQDVVNNPTRGLDRGKDVPADMVKAYEWIANSVWRTSAAFRFEPGSADLDSSAQRDIQRVARWLSSPDLASRKFYIAGFGDPKGAWEPNADLASRRASQVARELENAGVRVPKDNLLALSYMAPIACNDTDDDAAKNRRVEIWIAK